jgi:hypothetical protein
MPLVTCIMPTTSRRATFRPRAVECFQRQQYPSDWRVNLIIDEHESDSLGKKLNRMIASSDADYFITWDDDDWHSPHRVERQIVPLLNGFDLSGTSEIAYVDDRTNTAWLYQGNPRHWLGGIAFQRALWERLWFEDKSWGVDNRWQTRLRSTSKFFDLADPTLFIASIHDGNTCHKNPSGPTGNVQTTICSRRLSISAPCGCESCNAKSR